MSQAVSWHYEPSPLDQARFGIKTAKARCATLTGWQSILPLAINDDIQLLIVRVPVQEIALAREIQLRGALLCDVLTVLERPLVPNFSNESMAVCVRLNAMGLTMRAAIGADLDAITILARQIFAAYPNHYSEDARLPRNLVDEIYPDWLRRMLADQRCNVWVLTENDRLVGIASIRNVDELTCDVALFGMAQTSVGRGFGKSFLSAVIVAMTRAGYKKMSYSTQIRNIAARRMAASLQFSPRADEFIFHAWLDGGGRCS